MDRITIIIVAGIALIASGAGIYALGRHDGAASERADQLAKSIELIQKRGKTNAEVSKLDDVALCRELGGEWMRDHCQ